MHLVVGLGNPGSKYNGTRHNIGFDVVDRLAERWGIAVTRTQQGSLVGDGGIRNVRTLLCKPQKYMNRSGLPVRSLVDYYEVDPQQHLLVIHDDLEVGLLRIKLKRSGGHGGHNGLRDLNQHIGNKYPRIRVGTGRPPAGWDVADFVLSKWAPLDDVASAVEHACDAAETFLVDGIDAAMNKHNEDPRGIGERSALSGQDRSGE